jgi:uncharacterized protein
MQKIRSVSRFSDPKNLGTMTRPALLPVAARWIIVLSFACIEASAFSPGQNIVGQRHAFGVNRWSAGPSLRRVWAASPPSSDDDEDDAMDEDDARDEDDNNVATGVSATNVLGSQLCPCCANVGGSGIGTGFYRNGYCATGPQDLGRHTVCVQVTSDFLAFSAAVGNDLSTPAPQYMFPGLKDGDIWCLCAQRWAQAYQAGKAPQLFLKATHEKTLDYVSFEVLRQYAIDRSEADQALNTLNEQRERLNKLL